MLAACAFGASASARALVGRAALWVVLRCRVS
jgi:hypothetical protein